MVILAQSESSIPIEDDALIFSFPPPFFFMGPIVACREGGRGPICFNAWTDP